MKISYRQVVSGKWLVCEAKDHTFGVGIHKVGTPSGAHTSGFQFGIFETESDAKSKAESIASERGFEIVEFVYPKSEHMNPQYIDLPQPDDYTLAINAGKTIEWYRGHILKHFDVTPPPSFGYDFKIRDAKSGVCFLKGNGFYKLVDLKSAIREFRKAADNAAI